MHVLILSVNITPRQHAGSDTEKVILQTEHVDAAHLIAEVTENISRGHLHQFPHFLFALNKMRVPIRNVHENGSCGRRER